MNTRIPIAYVITMYGDFVKISLDGKPLLEIFPNPMLKSGTLFRLLELWIKADMNKDEKRKKRIEFLLDANRVDPDLIGIEVDVFYQTEFKNLMEGGFEDEK